MAKPQRVAPSTHDIRTAILAAKAGKGEPLARMIKAFSIEDLAKGFSAAGRRAGAAYAWDTWLALELALNHAAGRLDERLRSTKLRRAARLRAPEQAHG